MYDNKNNFDKKIFQIIEEQHEKMNQKFMKRKEQEELNAHITKELQK